MMSNVKALPKASSKKMEFSFVRAFLIIFFAQSAGAVEYTDCITAEG